MLVRFCESFDDVSVGVKSFILNFFLNATGHVYIGHPAVREQV